MTVGTEPDAEAEDRRSILQLPIFSLPPLRLLEKQPGMAVFSPLHTAASVPFRWEEQPGKPRPCTSLCPPTTDGTTPLCLELPPRLQLYSEAKLNKVPSSTSVLEGPYCSHLSRSVFQSYSLRFIRGKNGPKESYFDGGGGENSPERGLLGRWSDTTVVGSRRVSRDRGLSGSLRRRAFRFRTKSEVIGSSFVFTELEADGSFGGKNGIVWPQMEVAKAAAKASGGVKRKRGIFGLQEAARSTFWAAIYGALKQVIPRRSNKWRKDAF